MSKINRKKSAMIKIFALILILLIGTLGFTGKIPAMVSVLINISIGLGYISFNRTLSINAG